MTTPDYFHWEQNSDGVVVLTMDAPGKRANTMDEAFRQALGPAVDRLEAERESITGVVIASAKDTFFAGGDLELMMNATTDDAQEIYDLLTQVKQPLRRLDSSASPSSPPSTARLSAAATRSPSPPTTASPSTARASR